MRKRKYLSDGRVEVYAYFICDKVGCSKQNNRRIFKYDRTLVTGYSPIINTEDTCSHCGGYISEPNYIEVDPYQNKNE